MEKHHKTSMKPRFFEKYMLLVAAVLLLVFPLAVPCVINAAERTVAQGLKLKAKTDDGRQRRFNAFYLEAVVQREKGNIDAAFDLLQHAIAIIPDAPEALYDMARLMLTYNVDDTTDTAETLLRRAVALEPDNYYFQKELADYYDARGMADSAAARYEAMTVHFKDREALILNLVDIYKMKGDYEALVRTLDKLEVQEGKSEEISMEKVGAYRAVGQNEKALAEINELIRQYPADLRYRVMLGGIYYDEKQPQKALEEYRKVLVEEPENEAANFAMLKYYQDEGQDSLFIKTAKTISLDGKFSTKTRAIALNQLVAGSAKGKTDSLNVLSVFRAIEAQPEADAVLLDMYQAYLVMLKVPVDTVVPVWKKVLGLKPDYSQLRLKLLQYCIQKSDFAEAARLCEEGAQYEPEQVAYYFYGGMALFSLKENERAAEILKRGAGQINNETSIALASDIYSFLGDVYHEMGKAEQAYQAYDSALVYKDDNISALNNYAYYLSLERRELDRAAEMSYKTVKAEPNNAIYLDTYAWVLFEQGKLEEAYTYINEALKNISATEENASIYEHAGDIFSMRGNTEEAVEMWKKAETLKSKSKTLKKKIKSKKYIAQ